MSWESPQLIPGETDADRGEKVAGNPGEILSGFKQLVNKRRRLSPAGRSPLLKQDGGKKVFFFSEPPARKKFGGKTSKGDPAESPNLFHISLLNSPLLPDHLEKGFDLTPN